jgi:hypothetical protein
MGKKKRTSDEFWDDVEAGGFESEEESGVNGDIVQKELEGGTDKNYAQRLDRWDA